MESEKGELQHKLYATEEELSFQKGMLEKLYNFSKNLRMIKKQLIFKIKEYYLSLLTRNLDTLLATESLVYLFKGYQLIQAQFPYDKLPNYLDDFHINYMESIASLSLRIDQAKKDI